MAQGAVMAVGAPPTFRHQVARALHMDAETVAWVPSVTAAEEILGADGTEADVLVLSPRVKDPDALGLAGYVGERFPTTAVVVVREHAPDGLLPLAMRAGVRDVVDLSLGSEELEEALVRALGWSASLHTARGEAALEPVRLGEVFSVFSSKGGTGKTFVACNLALALSRRTGTDTALVDLDLSMGDVFSYFGREPEGSVQDLLQLTDQVGDDMIRAGGTMLDEHLWGYAAPPDPAAATVPGETIGRFLRALRGSFAHVVIDAPAGYSDQVLASLDLSSSILLVTGLDVVGVRHLSVAVETLLALGVPRERLRFVLNRADSKVGLDIEEVQRVLGLDADALIPSSRLVPQSLNQGRPVYIDQPDSEVAAALDALAAELTGDIPNAPVVKRRRLFGSSRR